jgi:hypothetical protein
MSENARLSDLDEHLGNSNPFIKQNLLTNMTSLPQLTETDQEHEDLTEVHSEENSDPDLQLQTFLEVK